MKVNDGAVRIFMEDNIEGLVSQILGYFNSSSSTVNFKLGNLFNKDGKLRVSSDLINVSADNVESAYENTYLANLSSKWWIERALQDISPFQKINTKKAIMTYFITRGFHITFRESFKLNDHLDISGYDKAYLDKLNADNKSINEAIQKYYEISDNQAGEAFNRLLNWAIDNIPPAYVDDLKTKGINLLKMEQSSMINNMIAGLDPKLAEDYRSRINEFLSYGRDSKWFTPDASLIYKPVFGIGKDAYRNNLKDGLHLLVTTDPSLARTVIERL